MTISAVLTGFLVDAVTTTAVDVISQRSIDPRIRMAGRLWRSYSLIDKALDVHGSIRIAAYSDAAGIIASEIVIEKISTSTQSALPSVNGLNFKLIEKSESLLVHPDFSQRNVHDPSPLDPVQNRGDRSGFHKANFDSHGAALFEMTATCIEGAVRAQRTACGLLNNSECNEPRETPTFGWEPNWLDRVNTGLGYALWVPIPTIGVGNGRYTYGEYKGTFRRDEAEGYGRIDFNDGAIYLGQVRHGEPFGYGVVSYPDGKVFAGHKSPKDRDLGVVITPDRDKAIVGASYGAKLRGYGRQIGLSHGVGSVSGFWHDDELSLETPTQGSIHRRLQQSYKGAIYAAMHEELASNADEHGSAEDVIDQKFIDLIGQLTLDIT